LSVEWHIRTYVNTLVEKVLTHLHYYKPVVLMLIDNSVCFSAFNTQRCVTRWKEYVNVFSEIPKNILLEIIFSDKSASFLHKRKRFRIRA